MVPERISPIWNGASDKIFTVTVDNFKINAFLNTFESIPWLEREKESAREIELYNVVK